MFVNLTTVVTSDCFSISVSRYLSLYFTCFSRLCLFTRTAANANSGPDSLAPLCDVTHSRAGLLAPPLSPSLPHLPSPPSAPARRKQWTYCVRHRGLSGNFGQHRALVRWFHTDHSLHRNVRSFSYSAHLKISKTLDLLCVVH